MSFFSDVLIAALSDTLTEHPELLSPNREQISSIAENQQHYVRQMLELSPEEKLSIRNSFQYQTQARNKQLQDELKTTKIGTHVPLGIGKYKNP